MIKLGHLWSNLQNLKRSAPPVHILFDFIVIVNTVCIGFFFFSYEASGTAYKESQAKKSSEM